MNFYPLLLIIQLRGRSSLFLSLSGTPHTRSWTRVRTWARHVQRAPGPYPMPARWPAHGTSRSSLSSVVGDAELPARAQTYIRHVSRSSALSRDLSCRLSPWPRSSGWRVTPWPWADATRLQRSSTPVISSRSPLLVTLSHQHHNNRSKMYSF